MSRRLCIELHDVAPATWPQCAALLALLDELGGPPLTLLAVPDYHGQGLLGTAPVLVRALRRRLDRGDEIALHGYFHRDDAPPPRDPLAWSRRRVLTCGEGEFAALTQVEAERRIERGRLELAELFGPVRGFVAPAWLTGAAAWQALSASPLAYAATRSTLVELPDLHATAAPAITVSARSPWRRVASRIWLRAMREATARSPLLRVALHPTDAHHPRVLDDWRRALRRLLAEREPMTVARALAQS